MKPFEFHIKKYIKRSTKENIFMIFLLLVLLSNDEEIMIKMIKIWREISPKKSPLACNEKNFKHII